MGHVLLPLSSTHIPLFPSSFTFFYQFMAIILPLMQSVLNDCWSLALGLGSLDLSGTLSNWIPSESVLYTVMCVIGVSSGPWHLISHWVGVPVKLSLWYFAHSYHTPWFSRDISGSPMGTYNSRKEGHVSVYFSFVISFSCLASCQHVPSQPAIWEPRWQSCLTLSSYQERELPQNHVMYSWLLWRCH